MTNEPEGIVEVKTLLGTKKQIYWRHLDYADLIVCLVVSRLDEDSTRLPVVKIPPILPSGILHHRLDLLPSSSRLCAYNNRPATLETGVVYLSPWCFKSAEEQSKLMDTAPAVTMQSYMAYLKDTTRLLTNPGMQESVKAEVGMLAQILRHFKQRHEESPIKRYVVQRLEIN